MAIFTRSDVSSPQLRRQLKQKRKKLRRIRLEVRNLREELLRHHGGVETAEESDGKELLPGDQSTRSEIPSEAPSTPHLVEGEKRRKKKRRKHKKRGWRKELMRQLRKLNRKLNLFTATAESDAPALTPSEAESTKSLVQQAEKALKISVKKKRRGRKRKAKVNPRSYLRVGCSRDGGLTKTKIYVTKKDK